MSIYQFTFQPTVTDPSIRDNGPLEVLATGTLDECQGAWSAVVTGFYQDYTKCPTIGLLTKLGHLYSFHEGGEGSYRISLAPELTEDPTYEVRPANENVWTAAGHTMEDAEAVMRRMGEGPSRLLVLRNNENGALAVYDANSLGYLDFKGTYESFYGSAR